MTLLSLRDPLRGVANPKIGVRRLCEPFRPIIAGIATVVTLLRNDVLVYCHYK